jgi:hypothetical protein
MFQSMPLQRAVYSETSITEEPSRNLDTGRELVSPNSPDFVQVDWFPLDGTYNLYGDVNPLP